MRGSSICIVQKQVMRGRFDVIQNKNKDIFKNEHYIYFLLSTISANHDVGVKKPNSHKMLPSVVNTDVIFMKSCYY